MTSASIKRSLIAVLLVLCALPGLALLPAPAAAAYYDITAYIDSVSYLIIKGNTVQWHNETGWAPGQFPGNNEPTTIITDTDSLAWYPDWPDGNYGDEWSSVYTGLTPALPEIAQIFSLTKLQGRGDVSIVENPSAANDYTLIVAFNDGPFDAAYWYEARLDAVPVPVTLLLLTSGLLGLGLPALRRRLRRG